MGGRGGALYRHSNMNGIYPWLSLHAFAITINVHTILEEAQ